MFTLGSFTLINKSLLLLTHIRLNEVRKNNKVDKITSTNTNVELYSKKMTIFNF